MGNDLSEASEYGNHDHRIMIWRKLALGVMISEEASVQEKLTLQGRQISNSCLGRLWEGRLPRFFTFHKSDQNITDLNLESRTWHHSG